MGRPGRRPKRLAELARAVGVHLDDPTRSLIRPSPSAITSQDTSRVQKALTERRVQKYDDKSRSSKLFRRNPAKSSFDIEKVSSKEATWILQQLCEGDCSPGEASMLIELGADVNMLRHRTRSFYKGLRGKNTEDVRSDTFQSAVESGSVALVNVLADHADITNLNQGLEIVLDKRYLDGRYTRSLDKKYPDTRYIEILEILMSVGADPNVSMQRFKKAISTNDTRAISVLCSGTCPLDPSVATEHLHAMVQGGHSDIVRMLLWHGADADAASPSPIRAAIKSQCIVDVAALCLAEHHPSPEHLAKSIQYAYSYPDVASLSSLPVIELLLAAGAEGRAIGRVLVQATMRRQRVLVRLLVDYSSFDTDTTPKALAHAISGGDIALLEILLTMVNHIHTTALDELVLSLQTESLRSTVSLEMRTAMLVKILDIGATATALTKTLRTASEHLEIPIVRLLVKAGASIDVELGSVLTVAVKLQSLELMSALLEQGVVYSTSLDAALKLLRGTALPFRTKMTQALLEAGAKGTEVDQALRDFVTQRNPSFSRYHIIDSLVRAGGKVGMVAGGCMITAIEIADVRMVRTLLGGSHLKSSDFEVAIPASNKISNLDTRYEIMDLLLSAGAKGPSVTRALIDVLERIPRETRFSRLLVNKGKPDVNLFGGRSVDLAVQHHDVELLRMLINQRPSTATLNSAISSAIRSEEGSTRLEICRILLKAGAKGSEVDDALIRAAISVPCEMDLVKLFVSFEASIDHKSGSVLQVAIEKSDFDLLDLLLQRSAQLDTMTRALGHALTLREEDKKMEAVTSLLNAKTKVPSQNLGNLLDTSLNKADDLRLFHLLLKKGASVDGDSFKAFHKAIAMNSKSIMQALMNANPLDSTTRQVFEYAWEARHRTGVELMGVIAATPARRRSIAMDLYLVLAVEELPCSKPLIELLLGLGAAVTFLDNKCVQVAVDRFDSEVMELLLRRVPSQKELSDIFKTAMENPKIWTKSEGFRCVKCLLKYCTAKDALEEVLISAVNFYRSLAYASIIVDLLVAAGATPNYRDGKALETAAQRGIASLVSRLLDAKPSVSTVSNAFPHIFQLTTTDTTVLDLIHAFIDGARSAKIPLDLNKKHEKLDPVLFLCSQRSDEDLKIMRALLNAGASADQTKMQPCEQLGATAPPMKPVDRGFFGKDRTLSRNLKHRAEEQITLLLHVADTVDMKNRLAKTKLLISAGANVNFTTATSKMTPLLAASRRGSANLVAELLQRGANVSVKDADKMTPLLYTADRNDLPVMKLLLAAGAPRNDGSLHQAAMRGTPDALPLLLDSQHDPEYRSPKHDSQNVLEVILKSSLPGVSPEKLRAMFEILFKQNVNVKYQKDGKSLLIQALDQPNADKLIAPLLDAFMGPKINEDFNLYRDAGLVYSALSYVEKDKQGAPAGQKRSIQGHLRRAGCREVFYHEYGPQPAGYIGAPVYIVQREQQRLEAIRLEAERIAREARERREREERLRREAEEDARRERERQERIRREKEEDERREKERQERVRRQQEEDERREKERQEQVRKQKEEDARRYSVADSDSSAETVRQVAIARQPQRGVMSSGGNYGYGNIIIQTNSGNGTTVSSSNGAVINSGNGTTVNSGNGTVINSGNGTVINSGNGVTIYSMNGTVINSGNGNTIYSMNGSIINSGNGTTIYSANGSITNTGNGTTMMSMPNTGQAYGYISY